MGKHRDGKPIPEGTTLEDASMSNVSNAVLSADVPLNPDGTPAQEGEITEFQVKKIGSVDIESDMRNKAVAKKMHDKVLGRQVRWNVKDATELFPIMKAEFAQEWHHMMVTVIREDPSPPVQFPPVPAASLKDELALYRFVETHHGSSPVSTYKVLFSVGYSRRGTGSITMPDRTGVSVIQTAASQPAPYPPPNYPGYYPPPQAAPPVIMVDRSQPAPPPAPVPAPVMMPVPAPVAPVPGGFDPQRAMFEMMQTQQSAMMSTIEKMVEKMNRPPGFIAIPDDYSFPIPSSYIRVPGGMIPAPQAPVTVPVPVPAPAPAPAPVSSIPIPPVHVPTPAQQLKSTISEIGAVLSSAKDIQAMVSQFTGSGDDEPGGPEAQAELPNPLITQEVGPVTMALNRDGSTNWPATLLGAVPKVIDTAKSAMTEYQKIVEKQAETTAKMVQQRTDLAKAVTEAQRAATRPQAVLPAQPAPVAQPVRPPPAAPPPPPPPSKSPGIPIPKEPIF